MSTKRESSRVGLRFALLAGILSVSFFGLMRVPWVQRNLLIPFTGFQKEIACRIGGDPTAPVSVGLSCSGADVIALCLGFVFAFPVPWTKRIKGAVGGLLLIMAVNTLRIATLTRVVGQRELFKALHIYIWPAILLVVVATYVFLWMNAAHGRARGGGSGLPSLTPAARRFILLTVVFVALFVGASEWLHHNQAVRGAAGLVALCAGSIITAFGGTAKVVGSTLRTANGGYVVTPECILTPLIPVYFAAALAFSMPWRRRLAILLAALPGFFVLGTGRLLVLALPLRAVGSHQIAVHGFYQFLLALLLIAGAAWVRWGRSADRAQEMVRSGGLGLLAAVAFSLAAGAPYSRLMFGGVGLLHEAFGHGGHAYTDSQGAALLLPVYQLALFVGIWLAAAGFAHWRRFVLGLLLLAASQPLFLLALGEWVEHLGIRPPVAGIRAWAVAAPALLAWLLLRKARARKAAHALMVADPDPQHG